MNILIEAQYLPPIEYFCALFTAQETTLERYGRYTRQSYQNRCYINTAAGTMKLVVPTVRSDWKGPVKDVRVAAYTHWARRHWRALESAYRKAPFFEHYADALQSILFRGHRYLFDLNKELLFFCLKALRMSAKPPAETMYYRAAPGPGTADMRHRITPKEPHHKRSFYAPFTYFQVFGNGFIENLSIIDLLFCEGNNAIRVVRSSIPQRQ